MRPIGIDLLYIEPHQPGRHPFGLGVAPSGEGGSSDAGTAPKALTLLLVNRHLGSDSEGYEVRMRRREGRWRMVWFESLWF